MGKMKEATMDIVEYVIENKSDFFTDEHIQNGLSYEDIQAFVMDMDEETFFVTLMLATPTKASHAV